MKKVNRRQFLNEAGQTVLLGVTASIVPISLFSAETAEAVNYAVSKAFGHTHTIHIPQWAIDKPPRRLKLTSSKNIGEITGAGRVGRMFDGHTHNVVLKRTDFRKIAQVQQGKLKSYTIHLVRPFGLGLGHKIVITR